MTKKREIVATVEEEISAAIMTATAIKIAILIAKVSKAFKKRVATAIKTMTAIITEVIITLGEKTATAAARISRTDSAISFI